MCCAMAERYSAVIVSPHLDDAVFSCAGEIAALLRDGPVLVLNLFTRYLADVKIRGVVLGEERYQEENDAARFLGYESRNLGELDVTFRREPYRRLGNIFRPPIAEDLAWLPDLRGKIFDILAGLDFDRVYVPLGIGWHVDHVLTHLVFETWPDKACLHYYEDTPYALIPHASRYRLAELGQARRATGDASLAPLSETVAWWQAASAYGNTALMRNLTPWIVRRSAVPVVAYYLHRLMALHRRLARGAPARAWTSRIRELDEAALTHKIEAMALYRSQFREFFSDREDCRHSLTDYASRIQPGVQAAERYWRPEAT